MDTAGEDDIYGYASILDALRSLEIRKFTQATHFCGLATLRYDLYRRLR